MREEFSVYDYAYILFFLKKYVGKQNIKRPYFFYDYSDFKELDYSLDEIRKNFDNVTYLLTSISEIVVNHNRIRIANGSNLLRICRYLTHSRLTMPSMDANISHLTFLEFVNEYKNAVDVYGNKIDIYNLGEYNMEYACTIKPYDHPHYANNIIKISDNKFMICGKIFNAMPYDLICFEGQTIPRYRLFGFRKKDSATNYERCGSCGNIFDSATFSTGAMHFLSYCNNGQVSCLQDYLVNARVCERCGCQYLTDGSLEHNNTCPQCFGDVEKYKIRSYHHNPPIRYYDYDEKSGYNVEMRNTNSRNFAGYGIELEVGKAGQKDEHSEETIKCLRDEVYAMRDGSINRDECLGGCDYDCGGFEIITFPHTERALYKMNWKGAFNYLLKKGYRSHDIKTCGLHIHISRTLLSDDAIINMMYFYEHWWGDIIKFSRRQGREAERWAGRYLSSWVPCERDTFVRAFEDYDRNDDHDMRYKAVNIQNRDTVEIRIMRGTLKLSTFLATLDFMITIAKNANHIDDVTDIKQWLVGMKTETYQYMAERKCFGYDENGIIDENKELEENIKEEEIE